MKVISRFILILFFIALILLSYLSIVGIETDRFNNQISNKIENTNKEIEIELKKIKLVLDPFKFKLNAKTVGAKLISRNRIIEIENIKTQISLKSLIDNQFSIENLEISTKSLEITNLISFFRSVKNIPELFILEKFIKKGYLIADIKLEFDREGKIKDNYIINGFVKDTKVSLLKKYHIEKLNFIFEYKKEDLQLEDILFSLNDLRFLSEKVSVKKIKDEFLIKGYVNHDELNINQKNLELFIKPFFSNLNIERIKVSSKNIFSFKLNKKFQFKDLNIESEMLIHEFEVFNNLSLKKFFPEIKKNIFFSNNKLSVKYKNNNFSINGNGNVLLQDKNDNLTYILNKKNNVLDFKTSLKIKDNPFLIGPLNYEKNQNDETLIKIEGLKDKNNLFQIKSFSLNEEKNKIEIKDLVFNDKFEIIDLANIYLNYVDKEKQKNLISLNKEKNKYSLKGPFFNANKFIDDLLSDDDNSSIFNINTKINIDIDKIHLDNEYHLLNFSGNISLKDKKVVKANLVGNFSNDKKLKFTINTNNNNKITTLYVDKAEPFVRRYKFIKGFDEGSLDFYSSKKFEESISKLKIYNFKLKELPVLTKILTLASLQGIADILSGEGIRFDEFEMNFRNKKNLMTIDEIYAIGPAISILMNGYVEKNKLISLRGTLVPATTINKFIGSLPVLGKILVGQKTGEGVFGVSFKIKGPPKNLETTVNPIKTLTPRFITRTLEKIKKN